MITNILASVVVTLVTNTVEHWPQKPVETEIGKQIHQQQARDRANSIDPGGTLYIVGPAEYYYVDDTNADTKSVETTITAEKSISTELEGIRFTQAITNWNVLHYSVEMQRVRTNVWRNLGTNSVAAFDEAVKAQEWRAEGIPNTGGGHGFNPDVRILALMPTNYFVPLKTNSLPLVEETGVVWITNGIGFWNLPYLTNFTILTNVPGITNIIFK